MFVWLPGYIFLMCFLTASLVYLAHKNGGTGDTWSKSWTLSGEYQYTMARVRFWRCCCCAGIARNWLASWERIGNVLRSHISSHHVWSKNICSGWSSPSCYPGQPPPLAGLPLRYPAGHPLVAVLVGGCARTCSHLQILEGHTISFRFWRFR